MNTNGNEIPFRVARISGFSRSSEKLNSRMPCIQLESTSLRKSLVNQDKPIPLSIF